MKKEGYVFNIVFDKEQKEPFTFKDIKDHAHDEDIILVERVDGVENKFSCTIVRGRKETKGERERRKEIAKWRATAEKWDREQQYLELKKEFEPETDKTTEKGSDKS